MDSHKNNLQDSRTLSWTLEKLLENEKENAVTAWNLSVLFKFIILILVLFVSILAGFLYSDYLTFFFMFLCDLSPSKARVYIYIWYIHCNWLHLSFLKVSRCCLICIVIISLLLCNS